MPAINLARLRMHTAELAQHFADAGKFVHELEGFFEFYADRTRRVGLAGITPTLIHSYNIPRQVMNQLMLELNDHIAIDNNTALKIVDTLWEFEALEPRIMAARILGRIKNINPEFVIERIAVWISLNEEEKITRAISQYAVEPLKHHSPAVYLEFLAAGLVTDSQQRISFSMQAFADLAHDQSFDGLPSIFRSLNEWITNYNQDYKFPLLELLTSLAKRSPGETAFFLRYNMAQNPFPDLIWIGRRVIKHLPDELEAGIHELFHEI